MMRAVMYSLSTVEMSGRLVAELLDTDGFSLDGQDKRLNHWVQSDRWRHVIGPGHSWRE